MRLASIAMVLVLTFVAGAVAQQPAPAPKEHSMTGCLQKGTAPGTYQLTNLEKGPKVVDIVETTAKLDPHIGHKVTITGTEVKAKEGTHSMKVTAVKMVSATCP
jgi:hypothetical protein